jgi:hypothetical protein
MPIFVVTATSDEDLILTALRRILNPADFIPVGYAQWFADFKSAGDLALAIGNQCGTFLVIGVGTCSGFNDPGIWAWMKVHGHISLDLENDRLRLDAQRLRDIVRTQDSEISLLKRHHGNNERQPEQNSQLRRLINERDTLQSRVWELEPELREANEKIKSYEQRMYPFIRPEPHRSAHTVRTVRLPPITEDDVFRSRSDPDAPAGIPARDAEHRREISEAIEGGPVLDPGSMAYEFALLHRKRRTSRAVK